MVIVVLRMDHQMKWKEFTSDYYPWLFHFMTDFFSFFFKNKRHLRRKLTNADACIISDSLSILMGHNPPTIIYPFKKFNYELDGLVIWYMQLMCIYSEDSAELQ